MQWHVTRIERGTTFSLKVSLTNTALVDSDRRTIIKLKCIERMLIGKDRDGERAQTKKQKRSELHFTDAPTVSILILPTPKAKSQDFIHLLLPYHKALCHNIVQTLRNIGRISDDRISTTKHVTEVQFTTRSPSYWSVYSDGYNNSDTGKVYIRIGSTAVIDHQSGDEVVGFTQIQRVHIGESLNFVIVTQKDSASRSIVFRTRSSRERVAIIWNILKSMVEMGMSPKEGLLETILRILNLETSDTMDIHFTQNGPWRVTQSNPPESQRRNDTMRIMLKSGGLVNCDTKCGIIKFHRITSIVVGTADSTGSQSQDTFFSITKLRKGATTSNTTYAFNAESVDQRDQIVQNTMTKLVGLGLMDETEHRIAMCLLSEKKHRVPLTINIHPEFGENTNKKKVDNVLSDSDPLIDIMASSVETATSDDESISVNLNTELNSASTTSSESGSSTSDSISFDAMELGKTPRESVAEMESMRVRLDQLQRQIDTMALVQREHSQSTKTFDAVQVMVLDNEPKQEMTWNDVRSVTNEIVDATESIANRFRRRNIYNPIREYHRIYGDQEAHAMSASVQNVAREESAVREARHPHMEPQVGIHPQQTNAIGDRDREELHPSDIVTHHLYGKRQS